MNDSICKYLDIYNIYIYKDKVMSDSVDARLVGLGFLLGVQLRSQGLVTNAVSRKYRQRNWSPATWSQQVSVNPAVSNGRCAHWWKFIYTFEWSNPQDLMHNFVGRHWLGASVCLCVCVLLVSISIYIFSNAIIISISCCFLAEKVERLQ